MSTDACTQSRLASLEARIAGLEDKLRESVKQPSVDQTDPFPAPAPDPTDILRGYGLIVGKEDRPVIRELARRFTKDDMLATLDRLKKERLKVWVGDLAVALNSRESKPETPTLGTAIDEAASLKRLTKINDAGTIPREHQRGAAGLALQDALHSRITIAMLVQRFPWMVTYTVRG